MLISQSNNIGVFCMVTSKVINDLIETYVFTYIIILICRCLYLN